MNVSTFCEIKYMNGILLYMIQVGLKILARTPIPKLPTSYSPLGPHPSPKRDLYFSKKMFFKRKDFYYHRNQGLFI